MGGQTLVNRFKSNLNQKLNRIKCQFQSLEHLVQLGFDKIRPFSPSNLENTNMCQAVKEDFLFLVIFVIHCVTDWWDPRDSYTNDTT